MAPSRVRESQVGPEEPGRAPWAPGALAWSALALAAFLLWVPQLRAGLTIDEIHTWWVAKDGLDDAVARAWNLNVLPPLYFLITHAVVAAGVTSEVGLRLPSVVAAAIAVVLVYRIGTMLRDAETGFLGAAAFVSSHAVALAAGDARPYALGLLAVTAAALGLLEWVERPTRIRGLVYGALAAFSVHAHWLLATALLAHPVYAHMRWREREQRPSIGRCIFPVLVAVAASAPLAVHLLSLVGRAPSIGWQPVPRWDDLAGALFPPAPGAFAAAVMLVACLRGLDGFDRRSLAARRPALAFVVAWHVLPLLFLFFVSAASSSVRVFLPHRYLVGVEPGLALLLAFVARSLAPARVRRLLAAALVTAGVVTGMTARHELEWLTLDWRRAMPAINELVARHPGLVLAGSGCWGSNDVEDLRDPMLRSFVLAPFERYGLRAARIEPVPRFLSERNERYLERIVTQAESEPSFIILGPARDGPCAFLRAHAARHGFEHSRRFEVGGVRVELLERAR